MKKLVLLLLIPIALSSQTVFTENMGTPSVATSIAANTFQNSGTYTYTGTAEVRTTSVSSGYSTASGGGNVFFTNTIGRTFEISGINTSGMSNILLYLGHWKNTTAGNNELTIEVSSDGITYTALSYSRATGTGTAIWTYINPTGTIPSAANLRIRFTQASSTTQFRIDDIKLEECKPSLAGSSQSGMLEQCTFNGWTYYGTSSDRYFAINKNGNTFTATPSITVGSTIVKTSSNGSNQEHGMWLMGRYWDATLASGSISTSLPVSVRFYYDPADSTSAKNARDAAFAALPGTTLAITNGAAGEWFKTPNGAAFNSTYIGNIVGNKFPNGGTILKPTIAIGTQNGIRYADYQGLTGFSGGTLGFSFGPPNSVGANGLPVTWAGFDASVQRDYTELIWHTASEQNTSHFEVEASEDGKSFKTISENIAAAGNSASLLTYSFSDIDIAPVKYYRLKQVDIEGEFDYSKIIIAKRPELEKQGFDMVVYPVSENYTKHYHLLLKNKVENLSHIQIADYTGKPVFNITSSKNAELLDLHYLTPGIYMIQVWNGEEKQVERVLVR
jgi:hypothetical protein